MKNREDEYLELLKQLAEKYHIPSIFKNFSLNLIFSGTQFC